jgi:hypothetical protein
MKDDQKSPGCLEETLNRDVYLELNLDLYLELNLEK